MWFGWSTVYVDDDGYPSDSRTGWIADCFVLFAWVVWVGQVRRAP